MHQQAISKGSFFQDYDVTLDRGSTEEAFELADNVIEGELSVGGQSHFYLETQCCIVVPRGEDGELEVFSSTQNPTGTQVKIIFRTRRAPFLYPPEPESIDIRSVDFVS